MYLKSFYCTSQSHAKKKYGKYEIYEKGKMTDKFMAIFFALHVSHS